MFAKLRCAKTFSERHAGLIKTVRFHLLTILTVAAFVIGVCIGLGLQARPEPWSEREMKCVSFPGEIYIRLLECLMLPLIISSVICALGNLDFRLIKQIAIRALIFYVTTIIAAVLLGVILVLSIHPGNPRMQIHNDIYGHSGVHNRTTSDAVMDFLRNTFTDNVFRSLISQYETVLVPVLEETMKSSQSNDLSEYKDIRNYSVNGNESALNNYHLDGRQTEGANVLGIIMMCIIFGIAICRLGEKSRPLLLFFMSLYECTMSIVRFVIWLSPIATVFMVIEQLLVIDDVSILFGEIGLYLITVLLGLFIHGLLIVPTLYMIITQTSPYRFIWNQAEALAVAFATSSSSASMPVCIRCLEDKNSVHRQVARFVVPCGIACLEGTALYEAVSVIFFTQVEGLHLSVYDTILISLSSIFASMGAAGILGGANITIILVLNSVGLSPKYISLVLVVDWFINRFRSIINVICDSLGAGIVNHLCKSDLEHWESLANLRNDCSPQVEINCNKMCSDDGNDCNEIVIIG